MVLLLSDFNVSKIELHYFLNDDSHQMNAYVRNKCENELLHLISEVSNVLDIDIKIESEAYLEGGVREYLTILAKNKHLQGIIIGTVVAVLPQWIMKDREVSELDKEERRLRIEQLKINIDKAKKDEDTKALNYDEIVFLFERNIKIQKHRSNFFKQLNSYPKVSKISAQPVSNNNQLVGAPSEVLKEDFDKYILDSDDLDSIIDDEARIEIISPVLKKGNYKWKGIYLKNNDTIDFFMKHKEFKDEIVRDSIPFKNGTIVNCNLEISQKLNELGEVIVSGYSVLFVESVEDGSSIIETVDSRNVRAKKMASKNQMNLFEGNAE